MSNSDFDKVMDFVYDALISVVDFGSRFLPEKKPKQTDIDNVKIIGHRGVKEKKSFPENTLSAFNYCIGSGADGIELDIHLTADNEIVVNHDETLKRVFGQITNVRKETLATIKKNAPQVVTLKEVFSYFKEREIYFLVEIKNQLDKEKDSLLCYKAVKEIVDNNLTDQTYIISMNPKHLIDCKKYYENIKVLAISLLSVDDTMKNVLKNGFDGCLFYFALCSEKIIAKSKLHDLAVGSGIVNYLNVARREVSKSVDFLVTDDVKAINKNTILNG